MIEITTNKNYWNCECYDNYIHAKNIGDFCPECGAHEELQPDSRQEDIEQYYNPRYDNAIFFEDKYLTSDEWHNLIQED